MTPSTIIAGGGPAGAATALALARAGDRVLLVDRTRRRDDRIGEALLPETSHFLRNLGVWDLFLADGHVPSHATHSAWGEPELRSSDHIFNPYGSGWHIDRCRFDSMLKTAAKQAGAVAWDDARVVSASREGSHWRVVILEAGARRELAASFLVDATGPGGALARSLGTRWIGYDRLVGIIGIMRGALSPIPEVLVLESVEYGWWYSSPTPDGALAVVHMTDADLVGPDAKATFESRLLLAPHTRGRALGLHLDENVRVRKAATGRLESICGPGWVAVGDGATAYDPLSGSGITKALSSALDASACLQSAGRESESLEKYAIASVRKFERYLAQRAAYYRMETRWPHAPFWRRRHSDPMVAAR